MNIKQICMGISLFFLLSQKIDPQEICISFDAYNPPFMYADSETENAEGLYPRVVKYLFERIDTPVKLRAYPWRRALYFGEAGESGIAGLYKTAEREVIFDYSAPIYIETIYLYTLKSNSSEPATVDDLRGKSIGVIQGWSYGETFDEARNAGLLSIIEQRSDSMNFKMLKSGRLDYVLAIKEAGDLILKNNNLDGIIRSLPIQIMDNPTYIAFNKKNNQLALLKEINELIHEMRENGSYNELITGILEEEISSR